MKGRAAPPKRVLTSVLIVGLVLGVSDAIPLPRLGWPRTLHEEDEYQPARVLAEGRELLLVAIVSATCVWSNVPEVRMAIRKAKRLVARQADERGVRFAAVGVAKNISATEGIEHLAQHGRFDEVFAGRGWYNTGVIQFIYGDIAGLAATPQLVVVEQEVALRAGQRIVMDRRELNRIVGADEIVEWVASGAQVMHR